MILAPDRYDHVKGLMARCKTDLNSYFCKGGTADQFRDLMTKAVHPVDLAIDELKNLAGVVPEEKTLKILEMLKYMSSLVRDPFLVKLAELTGIRVEVLEKQIDTLPIPRNESGFGAQPAKEVYDDCSPLPPAIEVGEIKPPANTGERITKGCAPLQFANTKDLVNNKPMPLQWVFQNRILTRSVGAIFGTGGSGKSTLGLQMACSLSAGMRFGPYVPHAPCGVCYMAGEDPLEIIHMRLYDMARAMKIMGDPMLSLRLQTNLHIVPLVGQDKVLLEYDRAGNVVETEVFRWLDRGIAPLRKLGMIIVDPVNRFHGLNENDNGAMSKFVALMEKWCAARGCAVLLIHHESKAQRGATLRDSTGRGASSLRDGVRFVLSVAPMDPKTAKDNKVNPADYLCTFISKNNYGAGARHDEHYKRDDNGILHFVRLEPPGVREHAEVLASILGECEEGVSSRDILKEPACSKIREQMKSVPGIKSNEDIESIIEFALDNGILEECEEHRGSKNKKTLILRPTVSGGVEYKGKEDTNQAKF